MRGQSAVAGLDEVVGGDQVLAVGVGGARQARFALKVVGPRLVARHPLEGET